MNGQKKIPVTIITGFLGAGKTTFINCLLKQNPGVQFALVENEFGEVAIDTKLIKGVDASNMFELKQGCICCSINDEYELVLQELVAKFPNVDHLLIETTGIADPTPVIQPLFKDENLKDIYQYNGTICLLDSIHFQDLTEKEILLKQLVISDFVLLNKSENLGTQEKKELELAVQKSAPLADLEFICFGESKNLVLDDIRTNDNQLFFPVYKSAHSHFKTKTLRFSKPVSKEDFLRWLEYTLDIYKNNIFRTKGILCFQNDPFQYILQGVSGNFELEEGDLIIEEPQSEVVFIGKLDGVELDFK